MINLASDNQKDWHKIYEALRANKATPKQAIGMSPFELIYGIGVVLPLPLELDASKLQMVVKDQEFQISLEKRVVYLSSKIEEQREDMVDRFTLD